MAPGIRSGMQTRTSLQPRDPKHGDPPTLSARRVTKPRQEAAQRPARRYHTRHAGIWDHAPHAKALVSSGKSVAETVGGRKAGAETREFAAVSVTLRWVKEKLEKDDGGSASAEGRSRQ